MAARVRPAVPADAAEIARVHCAAAIEGYRDIFPAAATKPTPASLMPSWTSLIADRTADVFVATHDDRIVGTVVVRPDPAVPSGLLLARLYVDPSSWGQGVGSRLHDAAITAARGRGAAALALWVLAGNARARRMYERRGWTLVPETTFSHTGVIEVLYELPLDSV